MMSYKKYPSPIVSSIRLDRSIMKIARKLDLGLGDLFVLGVVTHVNNEVMAGKIPREVLEDLTTALKIIDDRKDLKWNLETGFRKSPEYRMWAGAVKFRDGMRCAVCASKDRLEAHHIISIADRPDLKLSLDNGVALCKKCHKSVHLEPPVYSECELRNVILEGCLS